jgi:hypothetical protein
MPKLQCYAMLPHVDIWSRPKHLVSYPVELRKHTFTRQGDVQGPIAEH